MRQHLVGQTGAAETDNPYREFESLSLRHSRIRGGVLSSIAASTHTPNGMSSPNNTILSMMLPD
jgi:hypothetical protein